MKRVCHVLSGFFRDDARIFWKQCRSLSNEGYEVYILTNDSMPDEIKMNINIISCSSLKKNRIIELLSAKSTFLKRALEIDADIYQLHGPELIPLGLTLKSHKKKVFYDAHEDLPMQILEKEWIPRIIRTPLSELAEWYLRNSLNKFDEIFTVTPHIVDSLSKISDSVTLVTNYPIIENNTSFDFNDYNQRDNILCYSGTVYHSSNQEYILDAISNIKNIKYHIVGYLDDNYFQKLSKFKSWTNVKIIDRLNKNDLKVFFKKVFIGIVILDYSPNLGYKIGSLGVNKVFEYMDAGLPIICTDFDLWKGIIDKYECGIYVQPNNAKQIEDAINFLINNKEKAYQMGQNGKKAVIQEFNWGTQEKIYIDVFRKYLN